MSYTGTFVMMMLRFSISRRDHARPATLPGLAIAGSALSEPRAALIRRNVLVGSASVSADRIWRNVALMNACCRSMRVRSLPSSRPMPVPLRTRRNWIAVLPSSRFSPAGRSIRADRGSPWSASGRHIFTPPIASTTSITPFILTTAWLVTVTPVIALTVLMVQAAACLRSVPPLPTVNEALNLSR